MIGTLIACYMRKNCHARTANAFPRSSLSHGVVGTRKPSFSKRSGLGGASRKQFRYRPESVPRIYIYKIGLLTSGYPHRPSTNTVLPRQHLTQQPPAWVSA